MGLNRRNIDFKPIVISREEVMKVEEVAEVVKVEEIKKEEPQVIQEATGEQIPEPPKVIEDITKEEIEEEEIVEIKEEIIETPPEPIEEEEIFEEDENTPDEERRVVCLTNGIHYKNSKVASEETGANAGAITRCCNGNCKTAGKMKWMYERDFINQQNDK